MPTGDHAAALGSACRFCGGTRVETIDSVDIDGNHSNYEIKCRHCAALEAGAETGRAQACISSPPWEGSDLRKGGSDLAVDKAIRTGRNPNSPSVQSCASKTPYGTTEGQLG